MEAPEGVAEGAPILWTFHLASGPLRVENYQISTAAREEALRAAGFREVRHRLPLLAPGAPGGDGFWGPFLANPPIIFLECIL